MYDLLHSPVIPIILFFFFLFFRFYIPWDKKRLRKWVEDGDPRGYDMEAERASTTEEWEEYFEDQ